VFDPATIERAGWMHEFAQAPATLVFDSFVRVYFSCRPKADANGQYVSRAAYVDLNRANLFEIVGLSEQPIMSLGPLGAFDEFGTYPTSVIRHDREIRAYYGGWTRCASVPFDVAIGYAISRDEGVTFEKQGAGPVLAAALHEPFVISGPKIRRFGDRWALWYIAGTKWIPHEGRAEPVYRILMATSTDGLHWQRLDRELIPTRLEADECQASPDVIFANGRYHMFFCYRYSLGYRGRDKGYRIGYASSTDLVGWTRDDSKAGIDVADEGWDSEMISYPHVFELDGKTWMFYLGNQVGRHGFGLAELEGTLA
jgi:sucrose-6-phosphate hydrolase SacC (GH32 family)